MSFQITILKVLAGHPGGRASLDEVRQAVSLLISSGADWSNRMKRLAALAPELDIFSQKFVVRDGPNWQITDAGRAFLKSLEAAKVAIPSDNLPAPEIVAATRVPPSPPLPLINKNGRRSRRGAKRLRSRRSA